MIDVCDNLQDDNKTKTELLENIEICNTTYKDAYQIISILESCFGVDSKEEALRQLLFSKADLDKSIKVIDKRDGKIYGFLILSEFNITNGTPIMSIDYDLGEFLMGFKQLNGHSFIIDSRLRGTHVHKEMIDKCKEYSNEFDFIWCGVESTLKTNNYWKRLGFEELFNIPQAKFYIKPINKKLKLDILIIKMLKEKYEKNNIG